MTFLRLQLLQLIAWMQSQNNWLINMKKLLIHRLRTTLKFWSATMFWTAARNFGPVHKFELPTVIADSVPPPCHERLAYFHWPQWVTWLVTWWVTWSRSPDAGRHIGKFTLWTTLLRFSRSAQISLFSNFTKLGQLFFDNIFFGLTS